MYPTKEKNEQHHHRNQLAQHPPPQNLEGHKCIAVTKTGETIEGILEYRTAQPDMYVRIDSLHLPGVKPWVIVNQCESGNEMGEEFQSVKVFA